MRLILLHGWGASGDDLLPLGEELQRALGWPAEALKLRALEAPEAHPAGGAARQWYDLNEPGWPGRHGAVEALGQRLDAELQQAAGEAVVVLGFSQGAAMALEVALPRPVAAVIACSGYPHPDWQPQQNTTAKLLLLHGRDDEVVPVAAQQAIATALEGSGVALTARTLAGGHTISGEAMQCIAGFLKELDAAQSNV